MNKTGEQIYTGSNQAVDLFLQPTVKKEDFLTADGLIRQEFIKKFLQSKTVAKACDRSEKFIKALVGEGRKTDGTYSVYVKTAEEGREMWDAEKLAAFFAAHGVSAEDFKTKSKPAESLVIEVKAALGN
jgi:hypothetical protein